MSKKVYGIDLGTTNSIIGSEGQLQSRLVSSDVDLERKCIVKHGVVNEHVNIGYKVDMGLDNDASRAKESSVIVLKSLAAIVKENYHEDVEDVVISVPAYFSTNQRQAVRDAATEAGLNMIDIINEPTAAAIQTCSGNDGVMRRGLFLIYDLGGGTFDCTVIDSRTGKYKVIATSGLNIGGNNLDRELMQIVLKNLRVPIYLRNKAALTNLQVACEQAKRELQSLYNVNSEDSAYVSVKFSSVSSDGTVFDRESHITLGQYKEAVNNVFGRTISIVDSLLNKVDRSECKVVFVGGSTHDRYLCMYVIDKAGIDIMNVEFASSPDYTVAMGVIKYAHSLQENGETVELHDVTKQFSIEKRDGTSMVIIRANTAIPCSMRTVVSNSNDTDTLYLNVYQGNSVIARNNELIGCMEYKYNRMVKAGDGLVEVVMDVDAMGFLTVRAIDLESFGSPQVVKLKV